MRNINHLARGVRQSGRATTILSGLLRPDNAFLKGRILSRPCPPDLRDAIRRKVPVEQDVSCTLPRLATLETLILRHAHRDADVAVGNTLVDALPGVLVVVLRQGQRTGPGER